MAQSGFTPIQLYYSTTSGNTPLAANLANGELAINTADGILFYKDSSGVVEVLASGSSVSILSVVAATTANLASLSGLLTIDGVVLTAGQRVLVKDQTLSQNNGVYLASAGAWTRSIDANSSTEIAGRIISVRSGSANGGEQWATTFKSTDTLGTTGMSWFQVALQNTAVTFTDLTTTGNTTLGNASADTVTVNGTSTFSAKPTVQLTTATTNAVTQVFQLNSQSSGTPANGIGVGMEFAVETTAGNTEVGATIDAVVTDVTAASEDFDLVVKLMVAGAAAAETARFKSTGLSLVTGDTYQINGVDVLSATTLGSAVVNSSLTSVGTIATGTWNATDIALGAGGTNASLTAVNGGVVYSTATAMAITAAGTAGQALVSNGAAAPTFQELTLANLPGAWVKKAVDCATTAALTLNTAQTTIDGVTLSASSRVLVKDQATASQNGIYINVTTVSWTRVTDADAPGELAGATVSIDAGTVNGGALYTTSFKSTDTVGTTAMNWYRVFDGSTIVPAANGGTGVNNATRTLTINTNAGTLAFGAASKTLTINNSIALTGTDATTMTFPSTSQTLAGLGLAQTFTFAQTFRAANAVRSEAAATQDAVVLAGRAGGTSSFAVTLTPTTLTANRTITLPDGNIVLPTGTYAVLDAAQTFTAAQTFRAANSVRAEAAATQDAIILAGRAGGTGSFGATITTATLAASVTHTLPAITGTLATLANTAQTFTGATTISNTATFSNIVTMSGTTTNIDIGTSQTSGTLTLGGTAQTGAITLGRSTGAQTINIGTGANTASTKTINIGTGGTTGPTNITIGPTAATGMTNTTLALRGATSANTQADIDYFIDVNNPFTGTYTTPKAVGIRAKGFYTTGTGSAAPVAGYSGTLGWNDVATGGNESAEFKITASIGVNDLANIFYARPDVTLIQLGTGAGSSTGYSIYGGNDTVSLGVQSACTNNLPFITTYIQSGLIAIGAGAASANLASGATGTISISNSVAVGKFSHYMTAAATSVMNVGGSNVAAGYGSMQLDAVGTGQIDVGGGNICIGGYAGQVNATNIQAGYGAENIFIGSAAGYTTNAVHGNNNIGIGTGALANSPASLANAVAIGGVSGSNVLGGEVVIANGAGEELFHSLYTFGSHYFLTVNANQATTVTSLGGISFFDSEFKIIDNADATKVLQFETSGITTATTRTLTVPNASGTLALLGLAQTWSATQTFGAVVLNGTVTSGNIAFTLSGTTSNLSLNAGQTSGTIVVGGTAGTGAITLGQSTVNQTIGIGTGITAGGSTKTINIGTSGAAGSTTNIGIGTLSASGSTTTISLGSAVGGSTNTINLNGQTVIAAGTGSVVPARMTSGPLVGSVVAGAIEYDGNVFYGTADGTSGRGLWPTIQYFRLTADGTAIGPAIANFFGATSGVTLDTSAFYEVEYNVYFTKTTAGTVTFTLTYANAPINCDANYVGTPVGGVGTVGAAQTAALAKSTATASALPVTGSLTTAVNHQYTVKAIFQANATTGGTLNLQVTSSAGTVTPLTGSYYKITRLPAANTGAFV